MPPRKRQKTDTDDTPASTSSVPTRRVTRAAARGLSSAHQQSTSSARRPRPAAKKVINDTLHADAPPMKRVVRKGRLQLLPDLALEVQLEIYSYLESQDLLHLSQTCKKFRTFFLDRKLNERLWLQASNNLGTAALPTRPPFMSEPAFIHLLYSPYCHSCGAANVRRLVEGCFTRLCSKCLSERRTVWFYDAYKHAVEVDERLHMIFDHRILGKYFPGIAAKSRRFGNAKYNRLLPKDMERVLDEFHALQKPVSDETFYAYERRLRDYHSERMNYDHEIRKWLDERERERLAVLEAAKERRFEEIVSRLRKSDWEKEIAFMSAADLRAMSDLPVVRQSSKLTDGAWQKVLVALEKFLGQVREARLDSERRAALPLRCDALDKAITAHHVSLPRNALMDCRPRYIDFALMPECRSIMDVAPSQTVTAADFATVVPMLAMRWHAERQKELTDYILPHLGEVAPDVDPLQLAIATFECRQPGCAPVERMRYPYLLAHKCHAQGFDCFHVRTLPKAKFAEEDAYTRAMMTLEWPEQCFVDLNNEWIGWVKVQAPFHTGDLQFPHQAVWPVQSMRRILSALGLDPMRTTLDELECCKTWLRCGTCEAVYPKKSVYAYSWTAAYKHDVNCHRDYMHPTAAGPEWRRTDEEDMKVCAAKVARWEASVAQGHIRSSCRWSCSLCATFVETESSMAEHLEETHGIHDLGEAKRNGTIYVHPSSSPAEPCGGTIRLRASVQAAQNA
ncbi:hypothetical protein BV20DRAFT_970341 [Pilatotrama ljubarskyi]|nr:hypothetical protein BV20DRAFT_970341 [Pilatotrama ljubarskyi]